MVRYARAEVADVPSLQALWLTCFDEKPAAAILFFERIFERVHGYKAVEDGTVIAALYLVDCTLNGRRAHYLCGAATLPSCRRRGVMSGLIDFALRDARQRGDVFSVLCPADEGLYRFYGRLGYLAKCTVRHTVLTRRELGKPAPVRSGTPDLPSLQAGCFRKNFLCWDRQYMDFAAAYYGVYGVKTAASADAWLLYETDGGTATVIYAVYRDIPSLKSLLCTVKADTYILSGTGTQPLFAGAKRTACGMILPLTHAKPPDDVFIGITLQ